MANPVLALMAAGMGSRFGGLKQLQPVDDNGHLLMDFSVYDALRAGFRDIVFIIKRENLADFEGTVGCRIRGHANIAYAFQDMTILPPGVSLPMGRAKPLGTTHAVLCAAEAIAGRPFAAINADDYYGPEAFRLLYEHLSANGPNDEHFMVSYLLENTLTENGSVSRGICGIENGLLTHIVERKRIFKAPFGGEYEEQSGHRTPIPAGTPVSMNCWGFRPGIMQLLREEFAESLRTAFPVHPDTFEDILPTAVQSLMTKGAIRVKAQSSPDRWFGVTYREDKLSVAQAIARLKADGLYPEKLWEAKRYS